MMAKTRVPRIAVLGAGPIGLEAALYARHLGWPVTVFEKGQPGEYVRQWGHVRLFSPFGMNTTVLGQNAIRANNAKHEFPADNECITGKEHVAAYLQPLAESPLLRDCLRTETRVVHVGRRGHLKNDLPPGDPKRSKSPFRLLLVHNNKEEEAEADVVLDCTGVYGQHRWLGDGGIPALGEIACESSIAYGLEDILGKRRQDFAGKNILIVGTGYSAATAVCQLADLATEATDTWIVWLSSRDGTQPIKRIHNDPLKERDRLATRANNLATRGEGNVEFHNHTVIDRIERVNNGKAFAIATRCRGETKTWHVDHIIANVGYLPDTSLYRELQVHECYATEGPIQLAASLLRHGGGDCLQIPASGIDTLRNPEPNFFILGAKSYGRNSNFLLRNGFEQIREVFAFLKNDSGLNLYRG
ncbi:MAG: flavoprotein [Gemmatales bacterium]|nr:MAG: flavoprotein [Gemmatales bacterium]